MKKLLFLVAGVFACTPVKEVVDVINGHDGNNGHSVVSQYNEPSQCECQSGGSRLDVYLDLDDSLSASEGDIYQGSLVACNGANGLQGLQGAQGETGLSGEQGQQGLQGLVGPQGEPGATGEAGPQGQQGETGLQGLIGPQGVAGATGLAGGGAVITSYSSSSCTALGNGFYGKSGSNSYSIYDNSSCSSSHKLEELNDANSTFWFTSNSVGVFSTPNSLRVIKFN